MRVRGIVPTGAQERLGFVPFSAAPPGPLPETGPSLKRQPPGSATRGLSE